MSELRKVFICTSCEGIYADEPVTKCDCMPPVTEFEQAHIIPDDLRADVLALCEAAEQYALNAQCEIAEWVSQKHGYQKDADEITALAKRISERLRKLNEQNNQNQKENKPES